jgi:hypothetical protein
MRKKFELRWINKSTKNFDDGLKNLARGSYFRIKKDKKK